MRDNSNKEKVIKRAKEICFLVEDMCEECEGERGEGSCVGEDCPVAETLSRLKDEISHY